MNREHEVGAGVDQIVRQVLPHQLVDNPGPDPGTLHDADRCLVSADHLESLFGREVADRFRADRDRELGRLAARVGAREAAERAQRLEGGPH